MQEIGLGHLEAVLLILLTLVAALALLARRLRVPYPIVLVLGGLCLSLLPRIPRVSLSPEVVFYVFLPPLLFSAAFHISWRDFRNNLVSIVLLAFGLVGFSIYGVAATTRHFLPGFNWELGLVLGSVVATTDAIAATSTARRLGIPRGITDLLEAESLVNDGSGLLALKFTSAIVVTGVVPSLARGTVELFYLISAAIVIGLAFGVLVRLIQVQINDAPVEITISLVAPYVTYLVAEAAHCSGVLATIACGLYLGRRSSGFYSLHARIESSAFWKTLDFILNGLVFLLLGLQLPWILADIHGLGPGTLIIDGALFSGIVILLRVLWVYPGAWFAYRIKKHLFRWTGKKPARESVFLVGWAGMRGVLALAAAMSLPTRLSNGMPFPQRSLIIFLTFCLIFVTLVLQGLSMPSLIRRLGLAGASAGRQEEERARREMIHAVLEALEDMRATEHDAEALNAMERYYRHELSLLSSPVSDDETNVRSEAEKRRRLARELRGIERAVALRLRDEDKIHDEVLRTLERELDLLDARFAEIT
ncbi:MAG: Na+/H+ antiporter [Acidobacteriaceae bacterium]|nr:Na+/H+ antiporter [Acidobacteriaceae bacterium]